MLKCYLVIYSQFASAPHSSLSTACVAHGMMSWQAKSCSARRENTCPSRPGAEQEFHKETKHRFVLLSCRNHCRSLKLCNITQLKWLDPISGIQAYSSSSPKLSFRVWDKTVIIKSNFIVGVGKIKAEHHRWHTQTQASVYWTFSE